MPETAYNASNARDRQQCQRPPAMPETACNARDRQQCQRPPAMPETTWNVGDWGSVPVLGRSSGEGNGNPPPYSCLGNPRNREAWKTIVHHITKESDKAWQLTTATTKLHSWMFVDISK